MEVLSILPAAAVGYYTFKATTHPTSRFRRKMPNLKLKRVQVFPVIRVNVFGRTIHFHHWFNFSVLLAISAFSNVGLLDHGITRGLLLGGVIQGLRLPREHRKLIYKNSELIN